MKVHGYVVDGSILKKRDSLQYKFKLETRAPRAPAVIEAEYQGLVPDNFKPGAEVVAKGTLTADNRLVVVKDGIDAKCPSKYEAGAPKLEPGKTGVAPAARSSSCPAPPRPDRGPLAYQTARRVQRGAGSGACGAHRSGRSGVGLGRLPAPSASAGRRAGIALRSARRSLHSRVDRSRRAVALCGLGDFAQPAQPAPLPQPAERPWPDGRHTPR